MKRTTIMLPEDLDARLRYEARRRGRPLADIAREAIAAYLPEPPAERRLGFFGSGASGETDLSERVEEAVAEAVVRRAQRDG